jgi:hypothetical protein
MNIFRKVDAERVNTFTVMILTYKVLLLCISKCMLYVLRVISVSLALSKKNESVLLETITISRQYTHII